MRVTAFKVLGFFLFIFVFSSFFLSQKTYAYMVCGEDCVWPRCIPGSCTDPYPGVCSISEPGVCNACTPGSSSDCCTSGSPWTKYDAECRQVRPGFCQWAWVYSQTICSTADKCIAGDPASYLRPGYCDCTYGGNYYKTCCDYGGGMSSQVCNQVSIDTTNPPFEGTCPAGSYAKMCGVDAGTCAAIYPYPCTTEPCGEQACAPPPPPPTKYTCNASYQCVEDAGGIYGSLADCQAACQGPSPQCVWGGVTYNPGDKVYDCGSPSYGPDDCASDACVGIPYVCNNDGSWSIVNPPGNAGECTTACTNCRGGPPSNPPPSPGGDETCDECYIWRDSSPCNQDENGDGVNQNPWRVRTWEADLEGVCWNNLTPDAWKCKDNAEFLGEGIHMGANAVILCACDPQCNQGATAMFFDPVVPQPGQPFYIKVESNTGYVNIGLSGTDPAGRTANFIWDGVFGGEHGYANQWRWHVPAALVGTYNFTFAVNVGTACAGGNNNNNCTTGSVTIAAPFVCDSIYPNDRFRVCYVDGLNPDDHAHDLAQEDDGSSVPYPLGSALSPIGSAVGVDRYWLGQVNKTGKDEQVSGTWRGRINFQAGAYTFHLLTDDGATVDLEGYGRIISDWRDRGFWAGQVDSSQISLPAGYRNVTLRWYENTIDAGVRLWWDYAPITCTVDLSPSSFSLASGDTTQVAANVLLQNCPGCSSDDYIDRINFSATTVTGTNPVVTLDPTVNDFPPVDYSTGVLGVNAGTADIGTIVTLTNGQTCTDLAPTRVTVTPPGPWFQTQGGDTHAQGEFSSKIPGTLPEVSQLFSLDLDGYPGVVSYLTGEDFGQGTASSKGWLANWPFVSARSTYAYFYHKLDSPAVDNFLDGSGRRYCDVVSCPTPAGTSIYYVNGDLAIQHNSNWAVPSNSKIVVLVNGNLNINLSGNRKITVAQGGFLSLIVKGNINISGDIGNKQLVATPYIEGVYLADGVVDTYQPDPVGGPGLGSGFRFVGAGLFYAGSGFRLERNVKDDCTVTCNATTPSELFIFRPDLVINAPKELWYSKISWVEVAP